MSVFVRGHALVERDGPNVTCECGWTGIVAHWAHHCVDVVGGGELLRQRLIWEAEHPRPESLRRAERAIVRALAAEFGKGQQSQVTRENGFDIAVDNLAIKVRHVTDRTEEEHP